MKFVIACQKIEVTGVLPTCEVVGMTLWPKIKWVVAHTPLKKGWYSNKNQIISQQLSPGQRSRTTPVSNVTQLPTFLRNRSI